MSNKKNNFLAFSLLFIQPIFMASNLIVARGGVEYVPPISLAFWRWTVVVLLLLPFTYSLLIKNSKIIKKEFRRLFFLGAMGCGVCGAFPFLAGETTTVTNMGIIPITGLIMTKLDGTAKGGILLAVAKKYKLPIIALGLGEKEDDLQIFEAEKFADAFTQIN
ncbi:EamA family transporter [Candidatus Pelagibacter sp.]|nr:EamA family transporter [Candidatus Pelagibacter sp.]